MRRRLPERHRRRLASATRIRSGGLYRRGGLQLRSEAATEEDGSCTYPAEFYLDCDGACLNDEDEDGLCDEVEALIPPDYNPDWNGDYCYTVADLTHLLCLFGDVRPRHHRRPRLQPVHGSGLLLLRV